MVSTVFLYGPVAFRPGVAQCIVRKAYGRGQLPSLWWPTCGSGGKTMFSLKAERACLQWPTSDSALSFPPRPSSPLTYESINWLMSLNGLDHISHDPNTFQNSYLRTQLKAYVTHNSILQFITGGSQAGAPGISYITVRSNERIFHPGLLVAYTETVFSTLPNSGLYSWTSTHILGWVFLP